MCTCLLISIFSLSLSLSSCAHSLSFSSCLTQVADSPGLYSASLLQRVLPPERKPLVAAMFVDALEESGGESLSHKFAKLVPVIAWSDQMFMDLSGTRLTKRDVALFVYFLETNHVIEEIQISSCGVDASAIGLFGRIIRNCPRMHLVLCLDLSLKCYCMLKHIACYTHPFSLHILSWGS